MFAGGWTLEAAEAVCAGPQVGSSEILDLLASLVNKSLVMVEHGHYQEARYRLLETIRQYALEKLSESGEAEQSVISIWVISSHWPNALNRECRVPSRRHGSIDWKWSMTTSGRHEVVSGMRERVRAEAGLRVAGSLYWFWNTRGFIKEGSEWLERTLALSASQAPDDLVTRAKTLCKLGVLKFFDKARIEEGLALARTLGPSGRESMALAFLGLGACAFFQADYVRAQSLDEQGLKLFHELGYRWGICEALTYLGITNVALGDYPQAAVLLEELELARQAQDCNEISFALWNLGRVAIAQEDYGKATALFEESLAKYKEIKDYSGITLLLRDLGIAAIRTGDTQKATSCYKEALALYWELGHGDGIAMGLEQLAYIAVCLNSLNELSGCWGRRRRCGNQAVQPCGLSCSLSIRATWKSSVPSLPRPYWLTYGPKVAR